MKLILSLGTVVVVALIAAALAVAIDGSDRPTAAPAAATSPQLAGDSSPGTGDSRQVAGNPPERASTASKPAVLRLRNTRFGKLIHEKRSGLVAYLFSADRRDASRCYGSCAKAWPPIKSSSRPLAGKGIKQRHLRTLKRRGGARQVAYKGRPLYFYVDDAPGLILCHDVFEFGGLWSVVTRSGKPAA